MSYLSQITVVDRVLFLQALLYRICPDTRLAQPEGPTAGVSVYFYLRTEEDSASETL
jgi:hypothetical protein